MQKLLQNDALKVRSMLAVSTMVNNHCQKQGCSSSAVDDIMQSLEGVIGYRCSVNDGNIKTVSLLHLLLCRAKRSADGVCNCIHVVCLF